MGRDELLMRFAYAEAELSYAAGGVPVGAVMVRDGEDKPFARGHNRREQDGNPIAHGEMSCLTDGGRMSRYDGITMYTTLSPCMMCAGTIVQFGIKRVVIGENVNFRGNIDFLKERGVDVVLLNDQKCINLMRKFISEHPSLWDEDIAGNG